MASSSTAVNYPAPMGDNLDNVSASSSDLILGSFDPSKLHPLAGIEDKLDYLLLDDDKTTDMPGAGTAIPSRGWSDDLCYGTGTMYLSGSYALSAFHVRSPLPSSSLRIQALRDDASPTARHTDSSHLIVSYCFAPSHAHARTPGLTLGGVWGLREGARKPLAVSNARLRINSILNSITRRGTFIGNSAGCLGADPPPSDVFACSPTLPPSSSRLQRL